EVGLELHELVLRQSRIGHALDFQVWVLREHGFEQLRVGRLVLGDQDAAVQWATPRNRRTWSASVLVSMGLAMYPAHPAAMASASSPNITCAVMATTGIAAVA